MPVTARLSKRFYDTFGDDIVDWFNQVDATYRADLRQFNELNFARFDVKLEQRVSQLESKLEQRTAQVESKLEQRISQLESKLETKIGTLRAELIKWMFIFWAGTVIPVVGMVALLTR